MSFDHLAEPQPKPVHWPLPAIGFRPFFLLAAMFAAAAAPVWILIYQGVLDPAPHLPPTIWHAHEMIFGFAIAVVAGFLLTASSHWTGWRDDALRIAALSGSGTLWSMAFLCRRGVITA
jgi:uncharacterized protein involved in response to NO